MLIVDRYVVWVRNVFEYYWVFGVVNNFVYYGWCNFFMCVNDEKLKEIFLVWISVYESYFVFYLFLLRG